MQRYMLRAKIHRATITDINLNYEGSIALDENLLDAADMLPGEQVQVLNLSNGARFVTFTLLAPRGSGTVLLNGPAARLGLPGDEVIVIAYAGMDDEEARSHRPVVVHVDKDNRIRDRG